MARTKREIIAAVDAYIRRAGSGYRAWYVGIASEPRTRLFGDHGVKEENSWWTYREASSSDDARGIEDHFLSRGCDGGTSGGDHETKYFYAYRKEAYTNP